MSRELRLGLKRALDIVLSAAALLLLAPLLFLIGLAVVLDSPGPALFRLRVAGRKGRPFDLLKFRTMIKDAQQKGDPFETATDDPRITRVGRFLRRWSLDELPQLWNILRGEMSLVGPRPTFVEVARRYSPHEARRLQMRPGLTGWAQVNGRNLLSWPERVEFDLDYIERYSLWLDVKILARTLPALARREGVYGEGGKVRMHHPA
jgi:lipopolysaccharide/colanic/teichoic acid biosynthesis glycosyltransferase